MRWCKSAESRNNAADTELVGTSRLALRENYKGCSWCADLLSNFSLGFWSVPISTMFIRINKMFYSPLVLVPRIKIITWDWERFLTMFFKKCSRGSTAAQTRQAPPSQTQRLRPCPCSPHHPCDFSYVSHSLVTSHYLEETFRLLFLEKNTWKKNFKNLIHLVEIANKWPLGKHPSMEMNRQFRKSYRQRKSTVRSEPQRKYCNYCARRQKWDGDRTGESQSKAVTTIGLCLYYLHLSG